MTKFIRGLVFVLTFAGITTIPLQAQSSESLILNEIIPESSAFGIDHQITYSVNSEVFSSPTFKSGNTIVLKRGEGLSNEFTLVRKEEYRPGIISITAREISNPQNLLIATYSNGRLNGIFHESHDSELYLSYDSEKDQNYFSYQKPVNSSLLGCSVHDEDNSFNAIPNSRLKSIRGLSAAKSKQNSGYQYSPAPSIASTEDSVTIDLMLVYTDAAETWASTSSYGDIDGVIAQAMNLSQAALDNSKTGIELRLVHVHKTSYDETTDGTDSITRLYRLTQNPNDPIFNDPNYDGYMEDVHTLRDQYGADIVSMLAKISDTGGLGWRIGATEGAPYFGFNLNRVQQVASGYTLIHEIGHNMGNAHSRTQNSNATGAGAGLFHYSAGYQDQTNGFHTVMAYSDGLTQAPIFSSPDLTFNSQPAGTNSILTPENNALSMKEIKRTISRYRPTKEQAPVAGISTNSIDVAMDQKDELFVPLSITNNGNSGLVWDVDFVHKEASLKRMSKTVRKRLDYDHTRKSGQIPLNYSGKKRFQKSLTGEEVLYSTSFESGENFTASNHQAILEWRSFSDSDFNISSNNPSSGGQHLRMEYDGTGKYQHVSAPFIGYQLFGNYEVSFDVAFSGSGYENQQFNFIIYDGKNGEVSSGVIFLNGDLYAADSNESGGISYFSTGTTVTSTYKTVRIVYNVDNQTIDYYYGGNLVTQNPYLKGATPGEIWIEHQNSQSGVILDVDNFEIKKIDAPYNWLSVDKLSGVTFESNSNQIGLNFSTQNVTAGTYETILKVSTNDPGNLTMEVPVTLNVSETVLEVDMEIEDAYAFKDDTTTVPINLLNAGPDPIESFEMEVSYDPALVDIEVPEQSGTLTDGFLVESNSPSTGSLAISGSTSAPISDTGVFLNLQVIAKSGGDATLSVSNVLVNETNPFDAPFTSTFTVIDRLCGDVTNDNSISTLDASHVLRHTVFLSPQYPLTDQDSVAADVTANGDISALDAARILQYEVNIIDDLSCGGTLPKRGEVLATKANWQIVNQDKEQIEVEIDASSFEADVYSIELKLILPEGITFRELKGIPESWMNVANLGNGQLNISAFGASKLEEKVISLFFNKVIDQRDISFGGSMRLNESRSGVLSELTIDLTPSEFALKQNFPNPFNPTTRIVYDVPKAANVQLSIYNMLGQKVTELVDQRQEAGSYQIEWDASAMSSGVYIYQMKADNTTFTKKMLLIK